MKEAAAAAPARYSIPWRRRLLYALLPALLMVAMVELGLRAAGFHFNPHDLTNPLFVPGPERSRTTNPFFLGKDYFSPPGLALPQTFARKKAPGALRLAFIGGSSVYLLKDAGPLRKRLEAELKQPVEILNMGMLGFGSNRVLWSLREAFDEDVDIVLVYTGHNEFVCHTNPWTYRNPPKGFGWLPTYSRLYQLIWYAVCRWTIKPHQGKPHVEQSEIRQSFGLDEKEKFYRLFEKNLTAAIREARRRGIPLVLGVTASNLRAPPVYPRVPYDAVGLLTDAELQTLVDRPQADEVPLFEYANRLYARGDDSGAYEAFHKALLHATMPYRADRRIQQLVRDLARREGVPLVDVAEAIDRAAPRGIPGYELFHDHCHLNERGNAILMDLFADAVIEAWHASVGAHPHGLMR